MSEESVEQAIILGVQARLHSAARLHVGGHDRDTFAQLFGIVKDLASVVRSLVDAQPEPDPEPGVDAQPLLDQIDNEIRGKTKGSGRTVGARVTESRVEVQHPTVARIKFADGGVVGQSDEVKPVAAPPNQRSRTAAELIFRHNAELEKKNDQIANLEKRIFNQRSELAVLNGKQSENAQVMGWLTAIANSDKDVAAGLAAGKALSEWAAQTLRVA
ncbi:hypothetical protein [Rhodococcus qingshengii]|uniref:hypothetical protein n=1 Tax=Rhodococcus qingshengii TaxID=334542 RepID=UPI0035DCFBBC